MIDNSPVKLNSASAVATSRDTVTFDMRDPSFPFGHKVYLVGGGGVGFLGSIPNKDHPLMKWCVGWYPLPRLRKVNRDSR